MMASNIEVERKMLKKVSINKIAVKNVVKESKELLRLKEAEKMQNNFDGNKKMFAEQVKKANWGVKRDQI